MISLEEVQLGSAESQLKWNSETAGFGQLQEDFDVSIRGTGFSFLATTCIFFFFLFSYAREWPFFFFN